MPRHEQALPRRELTVSEDPVTGTWTLMLDGHRVEIERTHGFVKVDGMLHHAPFVQDLHEVEDLAGEPLTKLTQFLPTTQGQNPILPPTQRPAQARPAEDALAVQAAIPSEQEERSISQPRRKATRATRTPPSQEAEPSAENDERTVLPTEHAATYLGLSPKTLETLRTRGGGPPFLKLGRRVVYRKTDLDTWLAARVRRSTSDPGEQ